MPVALDLSFYANGVNLACALSSFTPQQTRAKLDNTVLCQTARSYEGGQLEASIPFSGFYKYSTTLEKLVEDTLRNAFLNDTSLVVTASPEPLTVGSLAYLMNAKSYENSISVVVNAIISTSGRFDSDNGLRPGKWLFDAQVDTATVTGSVVNNGAATTRGGLFHVHLQNVDATYASVLLQHSTSGVGSWATLGTIEFGTRATGNYTIGVNFSNTNTIIFNGVTFTAKTSPVNPTDFQIGTGATGGDTDLGISIDNLVTMLNASADSNLTGATYSDNHTSTNKDATKIYVTFDTMGTVGNSYTLGTNTGNIVRSATTLTGGVNAVTGGKSLAIADGTTVRQYTRVVPTTDGDTTIQTALSRI